MRKRLFKQTIIAFIFFSLVGGLVFLIFYINQPEPTCFDGIKNQNEEEIDCGGVCSPCELVYARDIELKQAMAISTEQGYYDLVALVKNPNPNYGSSRVFYSFDLYNNAGQLVGSFPGETHILPNQEKYLIKLKAAAPQKISRVEVSIEEPEWSKPLRQKMSALYIKEKQYQLLSSEEIGYSQVKAVLVNETNYSFGTVMINVLLFNNLGELIAVNSQRIHNLLSEQKREFNTIWFYQISDQVSRVEMQAEVDLFDQDNFIELKPESEKFQEY